MKIYVINHGDPSVGIWSSEATIDLPYDNAEDCMQYRDGDRNTFRKEIKEFFEENVFGDKVSVLFEDECPDCGAMRREDMLSCSNENCITNIVE